MKSKKLHNFTNKHIVLADIGETIIGILGGMFFGVGTVIVFVKEIIAKNAEE